MNENHMAQYISKGGDLFQITKIDSFRDGGTKVIDTTRGQYYLNHETKAMHFGYPTQGENLVNDPLLLEYLIYTTEKYIHKLQFEIAMCKSLVIDIQNIINSPNQYTKNLL